MANISSRAFGRMRTPGQYITLGADMSADEKEIRDQFKQGFEGQSLTPAKAKGVMKGFFAFAILAAGAIMILGRR